ncbi:titin-like [Sarcophilus harrisii]|uniref:titin-like n=1 Tax=Sarcophilus harrisii TaxID=9305 RepID=UPI001301B48E|nr:titin-like [Sarcophilus harrisii]
MGEPVGKIISPEGLVQPRELGVERVGEPMGKIISPEGLVQPRDLGVERVGEPPGKIISPEGLVQPRELGVERVGEPPGKIISPEGLVQPRELGVERVGEPPGKIISPEGLVQPRELGVERVGEPPGKIISPEGLVQPRELGVERVGEPPEKIISPEGLVQPRELGVERVGEPPGKIISPEGLVQPRELGVERVGEPPGKIISPEGLVQPRDLGVERVGEPAGTVISPEGLIQLRGLGVERVREPAEKIISPAGLVQPKDLDVQKVDLKPAMIPRKDDMKQVELKIEGKSFRPQKPYLESTSELRRKQAVISPMPSDSQEEKLLSLAKSKYKPRPPPLPTAQRFPLTPKEPVAPTPTPTPSEGRPESPTWEVMGPDTVASPKKSAQERWRWFLRIHQSIRAFKGAMARRDRSLPPTYSEFMHKLPRGGWDRLQNALRKLRQKGTITKKTMDSLCWLLEQTSPLKQMEWVETAHLETLASQLESLKAPQVVSTSVAYGMPTVEVIPPQTDYPREELRPRESFQELRPRGSLLLPEFPALARPSIQPGAPDLVAPGKVKEIGPEFQELRPRESFQELRPRGSLLLPEFPALARPSIQPGAPDLVAPEKVKEIGPEFQELHPRGSLQELPPRGSLLLPEFPALARPSIQPGAPDLVALGKVKEIRPEFQESLRKDLARIFPDYSASALKVLKLQQKVQLWKDKIKELQLSRLKDKKSLLPPAALPGPPGEAPPTTAWPGLPGEPLPTAAWPGLPGEPLPTAAWPGLPGEPLPTAAWPGLPGAPPPTAAWSGLPGEPLNRANLAPRRTP